MEKKRFPSRNSPYKNPGRSSPSLGSGRGKIFFSEKRTTIETQDGTLYYVYHTKSAGYTHGDLVDYVITRPSKDGKLAEVKPTKLIARSREDLLMRVSLSRGKVEYRILESLGGARVVCEVGPEQIADGDMYIVRFISLGIVSIVRYFGSEKDPRIMEEIIFFRSGVRLTWPEGFDSLDIPPAPKLAPSRVISDFLTALPRGEKISELRLFPKVMIGTRERADLRSWPTMTIDGADAKDLDDAISITRYEDGDFLLGVHIADVAEYVVEETELDREAYMRGTSIYTPGRVIPMLPEILSNDRCSLHPGSPKLTLSILMRIDPRGQVKESFVLESVIESEKKGIYDEISKELKLIDRAYNFSSSDHLSDPLPHFYLLYEILEQRRKKEGKILFETTECYFDLDDERNVRNIKKRERNDAHMMIEEFMVLANEEIAKWCAAKKIPFLSRVHEAPSAEKTREIHEIIALSRGDGSGGHLDIAQAVAFREDISPLEIRSVLEGARGEGDLYRLSRLLLPKMAKAVYRESIDRHFGLALKYYAHFTSPIRRYPDLLLHRMIKKYLHGELSKEKSIYEKNMKKWGLALSEKERSAEDVSRAVDALYMCRYMSDKVGQSFGGIISGLTESNIYVELESGVEGSIFLKGGNNALLKGGVVLDSLRGALVDRKGKILFQIGQHIRVKIREVDLVGRRVEMDSIN